MKKGFFANLETDFIMLLVCISFIVLVGMNFTSASSGNNGTMTVEVDIVGFNSSQQPEVSIEIPDYIFLGNVTRNRLVTDEVKINISNTGKTNITVTPELKDSSEKIFKYLFLRTRKVSGDPNLNKFYKIGSYSLDIEKPSGIKRNEYCYMKLDLTDYPEEINDDIIGHKSEIVFLAMAK